MQYQKENPYDARNTKTASSTSSWVRTSFILTSIMAVALYQMTSNAGILPENTQVPSNTNGGGHGRIFDSDDGLRGKERRRIKKNTQLHLHLHTEQVQNYGTEGKTKDNKVHYHFKNEPMVATPTATTSTATNLHTAAEMLKPAREEDTLDETPEIQIDEAAVDKNENKHEHEYEHKLDEAERKQDKHIINDKELTFVGEEPIISVRFTNDFHQPVHVNWMSPATGDEKNVINTLHPNESKVIESHPGHTFVAFDDERSIRNIFIIPFESKNHEDGNGIDQGTMTNVAFRVAMQENEYHSEPDTSQIEGKSASASKSVAEPEHANKLEVETQHQHQDQHQQIQPLIIANFFNGYHESIHINWISPETDEEERVLENVAPGESKMLESHQGHTFIAFNEERNFHQVFTVDVSNQDNKTKTFFHVANDQEDNKKVVREEEHRIGDKSASASKSVAEPEHAQQLEVGTEPAPEHQHQHQDQHQQIQPLVIANFFNGYHESIHINWISPKMDEEERVLENVAPGESKMLESHQGHTFIAFNEERTFRQVFTVDVSNQDNKTKTFFHVANDQEDNKKVVREEEHRDPEHEPEPELEQAPPKTMAKFVNNFPQEVNVNWIDPLTGDEETVISNIQPKSDASIQTHSGHKFVAYNKARTFRQVFVMNVKEGYTEIHKIKESKHLVEL